MQKSEVCSVMCYMQNKTSPQKVVAQTDTLTGRQEGRGYVFFTNGLSLGNHHNKQDKSRR